MKVLLQTILLVMFCGLFPREWQQKAPTVFMITGVLFYIVIEYAYNKWIGSK